MVSASLSKFSELADVVFCFCPTSLTITGKILFHDIIEGIKFFINNNPDCYPIILSLENHCSLPYQDAMADFLISILDDSLYIPDDSTLYDPLPSPEE